MRGSGLNGSNGDTARRIKAGWYISLIRFRNAVPIHSTCTAPPQSIITCTKPSVSWARVGHGAQRRNAGPHTLPVVINAACKPRASLAGIETVQTGRWPVPKYSNADLRPFAESDSEKKMPRGHGKKAARVAGCDRTRYLVQAFSRARPSIVPCQAQGRCFNGGTTHGARRAAGIRIDGHGLGGIAVLLGSDPAQAFRDIK